ncbi:hypothetical protein HPB51_019872 [Rhipicephalus microplus]|uniref:RNA-directed DNA polymerase from mobile element jockey n=1 Tax=Rhipicephalus microplus TaxID=6941 RepID=A0A9J6D6U2_RHIMP|nr:hypothetical protein HPB51_019872 [Rhipicephalus microplus]
MSAGRTRNILSLLDPTSTRTVTRVLMVKLRHEYKEDPQAFTEETIKTNLTRPTGESHVEYRGAPNEELDAESIMQEIRAVLQLLNTNPVPDPDNIPNRILRNLSDDSIMKLHQYIIACWKESRIPQEWKAGDVILLPKPSQLLEVQNMRPNL